MPTTPANGLVDALDDGGHQLLAVADDRRSAVAFRQVRVAGLVSVQLLVLRSGELPVVLVETGVAATNERWELRSSGLWVDSIEERPGLHWSYGLEAFALALDQPDELLGRGYGHRVPLGWELDFVSAEPGGSAGRLDGLLLTAPGEAGQHSFDGPARRWGWSVGGSPSGPPPGSTGPADPGQHGLPAPLGPPIEVALPLSGPGPADGGGSVWWVGHDGRWLTERWSEGPPPGT